MSQPQELEVWFLLPAIRREMSNSLKKLGFKQKDIATKIGVTGAAVSQYLSDKRANHIDLSNNVKKGIDISAIKIANNEGNIIEEIQKACNIAKKEKVLCEIHAKEGFNIKNCEICLK